MNPRPDNFLRLSFETFEDSTLYSKAHGRRLRDIWLWHEGLGKRDEPIVMPGICDICDQTTTFGSAPQNGRIIWWNLICGSCKMTTLDRSVVRELTGGLPPNGRVYHVGHFSQSYRRLAERVPNVVSGQYEEGRAPGEIEDGVRYEDLTNLSFHDGEFDAVVCTEVLEHIPDYLAALREMARVLKSGGRAIMSFPWLGSSYYDHLIRAEMLPDGSINHILPPEYHGDPTDRSGILSFRSFGWKILDEMREAGFSSAAANYAFSPLHGCMTLLTPVIVGTVA